MQKLEFLFTTFKHFFLWKSKMFTNVHKLCEGEHVSRFSGVLHDRRKPNTQGNNRTPTRSVGSQRSKLLSERFMSQLGAPTLAPQPPLWSVPGSWDSEGTAEGKQGTQTFENQKLT